MRKRTAVVVAVAMMALGTGAFGDDKKDESGKGKERGEERQRHDEGKRGEDRKHGEHKRQDGSYFHQRGYTRIPNGHLPPPGECRIWYPDRPAGHQPPPFKCGQGRRDVEPGGWLMTPGPQPQEVRVSVYDERRPGVVVDVGIFDARTGTMVRITGTPK
jgi:hypothetical protein